MIIASLSTSALGGVAVGEVPVRLQSLVATALIIGVLVLYLSRFSPGRRWIAVTLGICALDQFSKFLVRRYLGAGSVQDVGGWLRLSYLSNPAQGFGSTFAGLLAVTVALVGMLLLLYRRLTPTSYRMGRLAALAGALMVGGYLGIMLDRLRLGFVVDFLEFGPASEFVYNLADLAVLFAVALLVVRALQYAHELRLARLSLRDHVIK
jgi:signal peptidase II